MSEEKRLLPEDAGRWNPVSVGDYASRGGFQALRRAVSMGAEEIIGEIEASGLLGRGGAGFPTGRKWRMLYNVEASPKYIVCNADEGEPGAFKDRELLRLAPLKVIEGMAIAGRTFGARRGFIYIRGEYRNIREIFRRAADNAKKAGYLGTGILGAEGFDFDITVVSGAGAYVCGEETALLNAIEGGRGEPRSRPPYPAVRGVYQKPTLLNNTETFANIPRIIKDGAGRFAALGTETGRGTKLFSLSGHAKNRGVYEIELGGVTLREILYGEKFGGGTATGRPVKFFHLGGHSGGIGFPEQMFTPYNYGELNMVGLSVGSGAVVVMDDSVCLVDYCKKVMEFFARESCGKCAPCRIGTARMLELLTDLSEGRGRPGDVERLEKLAAGVSALSACGLGQAADKALMSSLKFRREEFEAHTRGECPAGGCKLRGGDGK